MSRFDGFDDRIDTLFVIYMSAFVSSLESFYPRVAVADHSGFISGTNNVARTTDREENAFRGQIVGESFPGQLEGVLETLNEPFSSKLV